jgi:hypothetical protein
MASPQFVEEPPRDDFIALIRDDVIPAAAPVRCASISYLRASVETRRQVGMKRAVELGPFSSGACGGDWRARCCAPHGHDFRDWP